MGGEGSVAILEHSLCIFWEAPHSPLLSPWCYYTLYPLKWILNPSYINYSCCYTSVDLTTNTKDHSVWIYRVIDGSNVTRTRSPLLGLLLKLERNNFHYLLAHTCWLSYHRAMQQTGISILGLFCVRCTRFLGFLVVGKWMLLYDL